MAGIFDFFKKEDRALSYQSVWGAGFDTVLGNNSGTIVTSKTALSLVPLWSAVSLISDTISTLPIDSYIRQDGTRRPFRPRPMWVDQPDVDMTRQAHYGSLLVSLLIYGNSYTRVFRNGNGDVVNMVVLDPNTVEVKRSAIGRKIFVVTGEEQALTSEEVIHIMDLVEPGAIVGTSKIDRLKEALGLGIALQDFAAMFFGQGVTGSLVVEYPNNLLPEQAKSLSDSLSNRHGGWRKSGRVPVLTGGATMKDIGIKNDQSQFIESRRFFVEEVARLFNIPLHMMDVPGSQSYSSVEQSAIQFVQHCLRPYAEKVEWAYSRLLPAEAFLKFNFDGLLRGDFNSRITAYSTGLQAGFMSVNDVRRLEDLSPVDGGDQYRVPLANIALTDTALVAEQEKVNMARVLIQAGFAPEETLAVFGLPNIPHTGIPNVLLQSVAQINPDDPESVYEG